jgi:hypothetical protein
MKYIVNWVLRIGPIIGAQMLYLTYFGVGKDGKALFWDNKNFNKSLPSLKNNGGLVPNRPGRDKRAKHRMNVV